MYTCTTIDESFVQLDLESTVDSSQRPLHMTAHMILVYAVGPATTVLYFRVFFHNIAAFRSRVLAPFLSGRGQTYAFMPRKSVERRLLKNDSPLYPSDM